MGTKRVLKQFQSIGGTTGVSGTMTGTAVITSGTTHIENLDNVGLDISWTGTPTGTIAIQCSLVDDDAQFKDLTLSIPQPAGAAGGYLVNLNQVPFPFIRVRYTNASGTGLLSARICGKDLN